MPIIIPHQSQTGIATANGGQAAQYRSASAFMTPGQENLGRGLQQLAHGVDKLGGAVFKAEVERQRMQNATDMLADKIEYENALRDFDSNYRQTHQGIDARTAANDYDAFHNERLEILQKKWGGNPYLMENVSRMAEGIRAPSMNRAVAFRDQQEEVYKNEMIKADWDQTLAKLADPSLSYEQRALELKKSEGRLRELSGQTPEVGEDGKIRWVGGRNVFAEVQRRDRIFNAEHVETLLAQGKTGDAAKYVRANTGSFGAYSNDLMARIKAKEEHNIERSRAEAKRQHEASLDGVYTGWRDEARKLGLSLEETKSFIAGRISDDLKNPDDRTHATTLLKRDIEVETMRRDANDEVLGRQYREYVQQQSLLPSQAVAGIAAVKGLSDAGREKLEKSLNAEAQKITPENTAARNELLRRIDQNQVVDQTQIDAFAFENGLTDKQVQDAARYMQEGGNTGKVTVSRVESIFKRMGKGKKMPEDLYQTTLDNLEPGKPATDERIRQTIANLYMDGEAMGSGWFGMWDENETYSDAVREGRGDSWLPDLTTEDRNRISAILRNRNIKVTEERMRIYKREEKGLPAWRGTK